MPTTAHYLTGVIMDADEEMIAAVRQTISDQHAPRASAAFHAQLPADLYTPTSTHAASGMDSAAASSHEAHLGTRPPGGERLLETARGTQGTDDDLHPAAEAPLFGVAQVSAQTQSTSGSVHIHAETAGLSGVLANIAASSFVSSPCRPGVEPHWTRRLQHQRATVAGRCRICHDLTRTLCKGCARPVCYQCAKLKRHCIGVG